MPVKYVFSKFLEPPIADLPVGHVQCELLARDDGFEARVHQPELHVLFVQSRPHVVPVELGGGAGRGPAAGGGDGAAEAVNTPGHGDLGGQKLVRLALGGGPGRGGGVLAVRSVVTILKTRECCSQDVGVS